MSIIIRKGTLGDTESFIRFLDEIKAGMSNSEWFYLDPPDLVRRMMADGIMEMWLALDESRISAVFSILYPGLHSYNYGYDLDFSVKDLLKVIHMDTAAVHPDFRGLGLQKRMVHLAEQELSGGGHKILLSTVHPDNQFSLSNMLHQGYVIQKRMRKYGSERFVLRKDIF